MGKYLKKANETRIIRKLKKLDDPEFKIATLQKVVMDVMDCHHPSTITLMIQALHMKGHIERGEAPFSWRLANDSTN
jgi:hypothetical protein